MDHSRKSGNYLMHYHQCARCGHLSRREDHTVRAIASGIYTCPQCSHEGPLNIRIAEEESASIAGTR